MIALMALIVMILGLRSKHMALLDYKGQLKRMLITHLCVGELVLENQINSKVL